MYNSNFNSYGTNPYLGYNNYYQPQLQPQMQPINNYRGNINGLQGKQIDSLDVVKATDIPLDGSISYFPLADGKAIATKQLMQDGTSKIIIYKPDLDDNISQGPKYITEKDLDSHLKDLNSKELKDLKDIKEDIKSLKRKVEDITDDLKDKKEK